MPATPPQNAQLLVDLEDPRVVERLQGLFGGSAAQRAKKGPVRQKRKAKAGAMAALTVARKGQQQELSGKDDRRWKTIARESWRNSTGLTRAKDFFNYQCVSEDTVRRCEEGETAPEACMSKLFLGNGWANCLWNKTILDKCVAEVLRKQAEDAGHYDVPDVTDGYLAALFFNCLKDARSEWSRHQPRPGESVVEARKRAEAYDVSRRQKNIMHARKKNKFATRCQTTEKMLRISVAKGDTAGAETWKWLGQGLLPELNVAGMLSEEDEPLEVQCGDTTMVATAHKIKMCSWRVQQINDYVAMIDKTSDKVVTKTIQRRFCVWTGGKRSTTDPPLGLPRAFYDTTWLAEQKTFIPDIETQLEISDKEFKMMDIAVENLN
ncbi:hypothetical protein B0H19DRAFT_1264979 [Mycena capillaripes]|nr:hypothetical protein B0H19DRAFT_1264979 [Mycena capillaripes]